MYMSAIKTVDSRGRLVLGPEYAGRTMIVDIREGQILLTPAVVIPEQEVWLYRNKEALASVQRGLKQAREGKLASNPDFEAFLRSAKEDQEDL